MRKLCVRVIIAILLSASPAFAQTVVLGSGSREEVGPGTQVVVQPAGVEVQSGGSFVMAGSGSTALAQLLGPTAGIPISVLSGGSVQLEWARLENLSTLAIATGGKLIRVRETSFEDTGGFNPALPWVDISAVSDRDSLTFSFNRVSFEGGTNRKNIKASGTTPIVRVLGNSTTPGTRWGEPNDDESSGNSILWYTGVVSRSNPTGVYDTVEEALRASGTAAGSTITVNLGHTMIDDVIDFNTLPLNGASSAGPTVVNACLAPLVGKGFFDSDADSIRRGKIVNCVLARGSVEETTAENCTFYDPRASVVILVSNITGTNCLVESGTGISLPANCITTANDAYFTSAAGYNFHLGSGGVNAIDTGTSIVGGITVDFEGTPRASIGKSGSSAAWDIGADEVPLPPPQSLSITVMGSSAVLSWNSVPGATSYNIKRATAPGGPYEIVPGGSGVTQTTFTDSGLTAGSTYYYVVEASNSSGTSIISNETSATPLSPPSGLSAVSHGSRVDLTWSPPSGTITGYNVYRSTNSGGPFSLKVNPEVVTNTHYEDAAANGIYYFIVRALDMSSQESGNSNIATAAVNSIAPPTGLTASGLDARIALNWNPVSGAILYGIYRSTTSGGPYDVSITTTNTTFLDVNLVGGQTYYYIVTAFNSSGQGLPSAEVYATPLAQSTFDALLVVGNTTLNSGDAALHTRLTNLGFSVVVQSDGAATSADATGKALVVISATVNASNVGSKFTGVTIPVLSCSSGTFYALGLTHSTSGSDFGTSAGETQVSMSTGVAASHMMAAKLTGTINVHSSSETLSWGIPSFSAYSVASLVSNTSRKAIFGYEAGDPFMPGATAPARRVGFFLSATGAAALTTDGGTLFDAAARWAADTAIAIPTLRTVGSGSQILIQWEPSANALSYRIYRSTSATGTFTEIASGVTFTSYIDTAASPNITYYYKIVAQNSGGFSSPSVVVSGALDASPIVVTVDGPPNLEVFSGFGNNDSASYTATVKQYINGVPTDVSFTSSWSFANVPNNETGSVTILNATSNPCTISATSSRGIAVILFTATVGGAQYSTTFSVQAGGIRRPTMYFQFPLFAPIAQIAADPLRTRRDPASYQNGVLWDLPEDNNEVNSRRGTARREIWDRPGNSYSNTVTNIWRPANIQFYYEQANNATGLILNPAAIDMNTVPAGGAQAGTQRLITERRLRTPNGTGGFTITYEYTQIVRDLQARNSAQMVNVYFVRNLYGDPSFDRNPNAPADTRGQLDGFTYQQNVRGPNRLTILIADSADGETVAHEFGHAIGLDHVRNLEDVDGAMNAQASLVTGAARLTILSTNLMWQTQGGVVRSGTRLMPNQIQDAQREMDAMKRNNPKLLDFPDP